MKIISFLVVVFALFALAAPHADARHHGNGAGLRANHHQRAADRHQRKADRHQRVADRP